MRILLGLLILLTAAAAPATGQLYPFLPIAGAPKDVTALLQDSRSVVWVGTAEGAYEFDGQRFYSLVPYGMPDEKVTGLAEDGHGGVWIGTAEAETTVSPFHGGLYRYHDGQIDRVIGQPVASVVGVGEDTVLATIIPPGQHLGDYNDVYLYRRNGTEWRGTRIAAATARFLTLSRDGSVTFPCPRVWCWITQKQIAEWPGVPITVPSSDAPEPSNPDADRSYKDRFGCGFSLTENYLESTCEPSPSRRTLSGPVGTQQAPVELEDGTLLIGGQNGIAALRGDRLRAGSSEGKRWIGAANGVPLGVAAMALLTDGSVLVGGEAGLYRWMHPLRLEYWDQNRGVESPYFILRMGDRVLAANRGNPDAGYSPEAVDSLRRR